MDDIKSKALLCEAIALLKEIAESRGQFYSEEEQTDYLHDLSTRYYFEEL